MAVARQQVRTNEDFLGLAQARHKVGQTTLLDVRQAQVTKGTSDVALLRAVQAENEAEARLVEADGSRATGSGRTDRAVGFVSRHRAGISAGTAFSRFPTARTRYCVRFARVSTLQVSTCELPRPTIYRHFRSEQAGADSPSSSPTRICCWVKRFPELKTRPRNASTTTLFGLPCRLGAKRRTASRPSV